MAREALAPGAFGTVWFEYYSARVKAVAADGSTTDARVRLPNTPRPKPSDVAWVTARVRHRLLTGEYRELSRSAETRGKAERALERAMRSRTSDATSGTIQSTWTVEQLAIHWLNHRRSTGLARTEGALQASSIRAMEVAVRTVLLGERKTRVNGAWVAGRREGGIGSLRIGECTHGALEAWLAQIEERGASTKQVRSVLSQMLDLAVRDGAMQGNPMRVVTKSKRKPKVTRRIGVARARELRAMVTPEATRSSERGRMQNRDLCEFVDFALGTGCRIGEILAIRWCDLHLDAEIPYVVVCGTIVEPREKLPMTRSPRRKNDMRDADALLLGRIEDDEPDLTLFLPHAVVEMLGRRRQRLLASGRTFRATETVFASAKGTWLHPANIRRRLRDATKGTDLQGTTPHSLRKTVATLIERELGMEAARHQMGHADPSLTGQVYVEDSLVGPDARDVLSQFFDPNWVPEPRPVVPRMRR